MLSYSVRALLVSLVLLGLVSYSQAAPSAAVPKIFSKEAGDGMRLRTLRRVGVGLSLAGVSGLAGLSMELNFSASTSVILGYGVGRPFNSFTLQVKRALGGQWFVPYLAAGYTQWFGGKISENAVSDTYPAFLGQRFLDSSAQKEGKISEHLLHPTLGVQYLQLKGSWAGLSVYLEGLFLIDIVDFVAAPAAGMGMVYYF